MALYFRMKDDDQYHMSGSIPWHTDQTIPFFPISSLQSIQADGDEKEFLLSYAYAIHSAFGGSEKVKDRVILTINRDMAILVYGLMLGWQGQKKFGFKSEYKK